VPGPSRKSGLSGVRPSSGEPSSRRSPYGFFVLSLVGFLALLMFAPGAVGQRSGQVFYVWFSVFNLTLGAIFGPWLTSQLAQPLGTPNLLLVAGGFLLLALAAAWLLVRVTPDVADTDTPADTTGFTSEGRAHRR